MLALFLGLLLLLTTEKGSFILWVNCHRNLFFDYFFVASSALVETPGLVIFYLVVFAKRIGDFLFVTISSLFALLIITFVKVDVFNQVRPSVYFEKTIQLNPVEGIPLLSSYSFPSGHSAIAFCLFFSLAVLFKNNKLSLLFLFFAMLVASSRVYLLQHFYRDVYVGSIFGIVIAVFCFVCLSSLLLNTKVNWLNFSIYNHFFRAKVA